MKTFPIRLQDDMHKALRMLCAETGESMNKCVVRQIVKFMEATREIEVVNNADEHQRNNET